MPAGLDTFPTHSAGQTILSADLNNLGAALRATEQLVVGPSLYNVRAYGAVGNGTTDDTTAIQNACNAANTAGGGTVLLPPGTYALAGTVSVPSHVALTGPGATLRRTGAATGPLLSVGAFGGAASVASALSSLWIDGNNVAQNGIEVHSAQMGWFTSLGIINCTGVGLAIGVGATSGYYAGFANGNTAMCTFAGIFTDNCAAGCALIGSATQIVTDNFFYNLTLWRCTTIALDLQAYCDSNHFYGVQIAIVANGATGVRFNGSTTTAQGIYNEQIFGIAIDVNGAFTGCIALAMNFAAGATGQISVRELFLSPQTWPGTVITDTGSTAWLVEARSDPPQPGGTVYQKGPSVIGTSGVAASGGYQRLTGGSTATTLLLGDVYPPAPGGFAGLVLGATAPSTSNWAMISDGTQLYINAPSTTGDINFRAGNGPTFAMSQHGHLLSTLLNPLTAAAGANAGTGPPAPVVSGATDRRGTVTFGTGTTPAAGAMVVLTFLSAYAAAPATIHLTPRNAATAALGVAYATAITANGFTISVPTAPAASQANTTYAYSYTVEG